MRIPQIESESGLIFDNIVKVLYNVVMEMENLLQQISAHGAEFELYFNKLIEYNSHTNLTAITDRDEVYIKHFLDSVLPEEEIPSGASVVDVGTGAGFPGLPIKIVRPDVDLTLVDSLNKRINFLVELTKQANMDVKIFHARAEDFCAQHRESFDVAVARAVAKLNTLLEYLLPLVKVGGTVLAYKGCNWQDEVNEAQKAVEILGGEFVKTLHFDLPNNMGERNIIVIKKVKPTPKQYPRGQNKPKTSPIC